MQEDEFCAVVSQVFDGDTLLTDGGLHIRLANVNAPGEAEYGYTALQNALTHLVAGKDVIIRPGPRDSLGRTVTDVWIGRVWVNHYMQERIAELLEEDVFRA